VPPRATPSILALLALVTASIAAPSIAQPNAPSSQRVVVFDAVTMVPLDYAVVAAAHDAIVALVRARPDLHLVPMAPLTGPPMPPPDAMVEIHIMTLERTVASAWRCSVEVVVTPVDASGQAQAPIRATATASATGGPSPVQLRRGCIESAARTAWRGVAHRF
jgi:hypothetical protein